MFKIELRMRKRERFSFIAKVYFELLKARCLFASILIVLPRKTKLGRFQLHAAATTFHAMGHKLRKKCNLGKHHCLLQRLKSTFFDFFFQMEQPKRDLRNEEYISKKVDFSLWARYIIVQPHFFNEFYCTIFLILEHCGPQLWPL